jgi:antitoxin VapB
MTIARLFANGRSQAVRLPRECRFSGREVCVARLDDIVILYPPGKGWAVLEGSLPHFTKDFLAGRNQPPRPQRRKKL